MVAYLTNLVRRLGRWRSRVVSGDEEWDIPLPFGRVNFEKLLEENVKLVELSTLTSLDRAKLGWGYFGNLDGDRVAVLVKSKSRWPFIFMPLWTPADRFFIFYGQYETADTGWILRGTYGTDSSYRWHKVLLGKFLDIGLAISGICALIYPAVVIQETLQKSLAFDTLLVALIMVAAYPLVILVLLIFNAGMAYFTRLIIELTGMGKLGRTRDMYWLLLRCAAWDQSVPVHSE